MFIILVTLYNSYMMYNTSSNTVKVVLGGGVDETPISF